MKNINFNEEQIENLKYLLEKEIKFQNKEIEKSIKMDSKLPPYEQTDEEEYEKTNQYIDELKDILKVLD